MLTNLKANMKISIKINEICSIFYYITIIGSFIDIKYINILIL